MPIICEWPSERLWREFDKKDMFFDIGHIIVVVEFLMVV